MLVGQAQNGLGLNLIKGHVAQNGSRALGLWMMKSVHGCNGTCGSSFAPCFLCGVHDCCLNLCQVNMIHCSHGPSYV